MSDDGADLTPLGSWFGPIPAWRFGLFLATGVLLHLALPYAVDGVERHPWLLLGVGAVGAALGVPLGRQDARGVLRPRVQRSGRLLWPGLLVFAASCIGLLVAIVLVEDVLLHFPLFLVGAGAAGVAGVRSRDRALARS